MRLGDLDELMEIAEQQGHLTIDDILNAPTIDAVPVVRCGECKLRNQFGCPMYYEEYLEWEEDGYLESDILCHDHTSDDGFCDSGERKGEG